MKEKTETAKKEQSAAEFTEQAFKCWEQAMRAGLKLQEDALRRWSELSSPAAPAAPDWQKRFNGLNAAARDLASGGQKRTEEVLDFVNQNTRTATELFKKMSEAAQAGTAAERQAALNEWSAASADAVRACAQGVAQISTRAVDSWVQFAQQSFEAVQARPAPPA